MGFDLGAFMGGVANGMRIGTTIRDAIRENRLEEMRQRGLEEARGAREQAINGMITDRNPNTQTLDAATDATAATSATAAPAASVAPITPGDTGAVTAPVAAQPASTARALSEPAPAAAPSAQTQATSGLPPSMSTQTPSPDSGDRPSAATPADTTPRAITPQAEGLPKPAGVAPEAIAKPAAADSSKFWVNGKGFATREDAYKAADAAAPTTLDFFMKNAVPKLQEAYIAQGDPAKAEAWGKWAEQRKNQKSMQEWASMYRAAQFGDMEKAADHAFNLYKNYDDGITPLSKETVKNKAGEVTGFNVRLKNDSTGEVVSQFIDRKSLVEMGLAALSPDKMFEVSFQRQAVADKQAADARVKATHDAAVAARDVTKQKMTDDREDARDERRAKREEANIRLRAELESSNLGKKERAQVESKVEMLRESGYSDEQIATMVPALVGAGEHKKTTDPKERRALIASDLVKNDPTFARLPQAERSKRVDEMMGVIYGEEAKPAAAAPGAAPSAGAPQYVKDVKTGEIYKIENGKRIPTGKKVPVSQAPGES